MTYITKHCPECGFKQKLAVYGYVDDPIGIRVSRCPACNCITKEAKSKEWVQMSPFKKYFSIHPRCFYLIWFPGIFLSVILSMNIPGIMTNTGTNVGALLLVVALTFTVLHYLFTSLKLSSDTFMKRYCSSILRSRNEDYMELLKEEGKIYDESIPSWILCSKSTRQKLDKYIQEHADESDFTIPTFEETINNV